MKQQLYRYAVAGGIAFVMDWGALYSLTEWAHFYYLTAAAIAFTLGLITNYTLSIHWVFTERRVKSEHWEFVVFAGIGVVGLGFNQFLIRLLTEQAGVYYMASKGIATLIVFFWNFFARKLILFSNASQIQEGGHNDNEDSVHHWSRPGRANGSKRTAAS